jgi:hypothetical protein
MMVVAKIKSFFQTAFQFAVFVEFLKSTVAHPQVITSYPQTFGAAFSTIFIHVIFCAVVGAIIGTVPAIKNKLKGKLNIIIPVVVGTLPIILILLNAAIMGVMKMTNANIAAPPIVLSIFCGWFALYMIGGPGQSSGYTGISPA